MHKHFADHIIWFQMTVKLKDRDYEGEISEVVSSWLSRKGPIPERWKADMRPTYASLAVLIIYQFHLLMLFIMKKSDVTQ